jgi:3'-phosphoadenosine 5'-phosphosulfate sulfotransferase (PAPS reductase)/FAD synthetase
MNKTIEQTVAETILEQPFEVKVGEKSYQVASASTATLILVSEAISQLPHIALDTEKVVEETLSVAKDCRILGDIAAILILGAKNITEKKKVPQIKEKRYMCGLIRRPYTVEVEVEITIDKKAELAKELLEDVSPRELNLIVSQILSRMQIADFFGLTTFLAELNLLHPRKVEN